MVPVVAIGAPPRMRRCCRLVVAAAATPLLLVLLLLPQAQHRACCLLRLLGSERGASLMKRAPCKESAIGEEKRKKGKKNLLDVCLHEASRRKKKQIKIERCSNAPVSFSALDSELTGCGWALRDHRSQ